MRRTVGTVVVMLVALFAVPVLGREFGAWRADGTARWGPGGFTSRDTESTNTGYMGHDYLSDPNQFGPDAAGIQDAFPWGIFWTSLDVNEADITKGVGPTLPNVQLPGGLAGPGIPNNPELLRRFVLSVFSPLVADLGGAPETTPDHLVIVPRNVLTNPAAPGVSGELAAYFPALAGGLGNVTVGAGRINPSFERFLDTAPGHANVADLAPAPADSSNGANLVALPAILNNLEEGPPNPPFGAQPFLTPLKVVYVVTGRGTGPTDFAYVQAFALADNTAATQGSAITQPIRLWTSKITAADLASPVGVAGISFADISTSGRSQPMLFVTTTDGQVIALNARAFDAGVPAAGGVVWRVQEPLGPNGGAQQFEVGSAPLVAKIALYGKYQSTPNDAATETFNMQPKLPQTTIAKAQQQGVEEWLVFTNRDDGRVFAHAAAGNGAGGAKLRWTHDVATAGGAAETFKVPPILMDGGTPQPDTFQVADASAFLGTTDAATGRPDHEFGYDDVVVAAGVSGRVYGIEALGNIHGPKQLANQVPPDGNPGQPDPQEGLPRTSSVAGNTGTNRLWTYPDNNVGTNPGDAPWPRLLGGGAIPSANVTIRSPMLGVRGPLRPPLLPDTINPPLGNGPFPAGYIGSAPGYDTTDNPDVANSPVGVPGVAITHFRPEIDPNSVEADPRFQPPRPPFQPAFPRPNPAPPLPRYNGDLGGCISDDLVFVRFDQIVSMGAADGSSDTSMFEWLGSLHPYMSVELEAEMDPSQAHTVRDITDPLNPFTVPNEFLRLGRLRTFFDNFQQPVTTVAGRIPVERDISAPPNEPMRGLYVTCQNWIDAGGAAHTLGRGDTLDVTYTAFDGSVHEEFLQFPSERDPKDDTTALNTASIGESSDILQNPITGEGPVLVNGFDYANLPRGAMVAARSTADPSIFTTAQFRAYGAIVVPSNFRGRFYLYSFHNVQIREWRHNSVLDDGTVLTDDQTLPDVAWGAAVVDDWIYVPFENGYLEAFSNGRRLNGTSLGVSPFGGGGYAPPGFFNGGNNNNGTPPQRYIVQKPIVRVIGGPLANPPTGTEPILTEDQLLYEWGGRMFVRVDFGQLSAQDPRRTTPVEVTLYGPVLPRSGIQQQPPAAAPAARDIGTPIELPAGSGHFFAYASLELRDGQEQNPMTPGTRLLKQFPDTNTRNPNAQQDATDNYRWHYELWARQQGNGQPPLRWSDNPGNPQVLPSDWQPDLSVPPGQWDPNGHDPTANTANSAPWTSFNNPIGTQYAPGAGANLAIGAVAPPPIGAVNPAFAVDDRDRYDADRYGAWVDHTQDQATFPAGDARLQPTVPTVGTQLGNNGLPISQALFGDHGHSTPLAAPEAGMPNIGKLVLYDRSDIGLTGGNQQLRLRVAVPDMTKLGSGFSLGGGPPLASNFPVGSFQQNANFPDGGPDNMYPSILGRRISVVRDGTNDDFTQGSVGVSPVTQPAGGAITLVPTVVNVSADIPTFQPDDLYATRWRRYTAGGVQPQPINPFDINSPYQDLPENLSVQVTPDQKDDRLRRVLVFVDSNHNGRLDLDPAHREAYRTFVFQVGVKPDLKLDTREQLLDFGSMWHGRYGPMNFDSQSPNDLLEWNTLQQLPANSPQRAFYLSQWRFFTPENTGNVNLAFLKPEARINLIGSPPLPAGLPGEALDPFRAFTFLFNPAEANPPPGHIYLRTSFDQLLNHNRGGAAQPYLQGDGGWLQKAPVGAPGPATQVFGNDPSLANPVLFDTQVTLNIPTGTPLGTYAGTLYFFNDRGVRFVQGAGAFGYQYQPFPSQQAADDGALNREPSGEPDEPLTTPTVTLKVKVTEDVAPGRFPSGGAQPDVDTRVQPSVAPVFSNANGLLHHIALALASNSDGQGSQANASGQAAYPLQRIFGTALPWDSFLSTFPFDPVPGDRLPWIPWFGAGEGLQLFQSPQDPQQNVPVLESKPSQAAAGLFGGQGPNAFRDLLVWSRQSYPGEATGAQGGAPAEYRLLLRYLTDQGLSPAFELRPGGGSLDPRTPRSSPRALAVPDLSNQSPTGSYWLVFEALGGGAKRSLAFTANIDPANVNGWSPEHVIATPGALGNVGDAYAIPSNTTVTPGPWLLYSAFAQGLGKQDLYLTRLKQQAVQTPGSRVPPPAPAPGDLLQSGSEFGQYSFPRLDSDVLIGNATRTVYTASGLDWRTTPQETLGLGIQVYISRADLPVPRNLLGVSAPGNFIRGTLAATGEQVFPLDPNQINAAPAASQAALKNVRVVVDPAAGTVRFSIDTRLLFRLLTGAPSVFNGQAAPDPEITADYTPGTLRLTRSDYGASGGAMTLTRYIDTSWFRQFLWKQAHPGPAPYVEGQADRLWVTWRRQAGAIGRGPGLFYKVFRPGVRVSRDRIAGFANFNVTDLTAGGNVIPEEVDPNRGMIYFPESLEGHQVRVTYQAPPQNGSVTEAHFIAWRPETDEVAVPMDTSVNEGTVDAFASYEQVPMTNLVSGVNEAVPHLEKLWLFWGSNRGTATQASDIFFATIAPRVGPFPDTPDPLFALASSGAAVASRRGAQPEAAASHPPLPFIRPAILRHGPLAPPLVLRRARR